MTVASEVKQTIASLKGVQITLKTFAPVEGNKEAQHVLEQNAQRVESVLKRMEERLAVLEYQEPQYKGF